MHSMVLAALFQSAGTVHVVPAVRKTVGIRRGLRERSDRYRPMLCPGKTARPSVTRRPRPEMPPAPARVQDVLLVDVTVTVPSAVVVPPQILLSVNTALLVALVLS